LNIFPNWILEILNTLDLQPPSLIGFGLGIAFVLPT